MTAENSKGFSISLDPIGHILRVSAWGFWDAEFMKKYNHAFTEKSEELRERAKEWYVFMDLIGFHPHFTEVQDILRQQITNAKKQGMKKLVYLGEKSVVQLQLNKLFLTSAIQEYSFVESEEEALQWLLNESPCKRRGCLGY